MKPRLRRTLSVVLSVAMLFTMTGMNAVFAAEGGTTIGASGLCEHHSEHTPECGYTEGTLEVPCSHEHTDECYKEVTKCVHEHTEDCYDDSEEIATGSEAREPVNCSHICDGDSGCITEELDCRHEHDEACGYAPAVSGTPCTFRCEECAKDSGQQTPPPAPCALTEGCTLSDGHEGDCVSPQPAPDGGLKQTVTGFPGFDPDGFTPLRTIGVAEKTTVEAIGLPDTLAATLDGQAGETEIPVAWETAADYENTEYETYDFTAVLGEEYALAEGMTDSDLPYITVNIAGMENPLAMAAGDVTTADALIAALTSDTPATITLGGDITLTEAATMGANHTLAIPPNCTLAISSSNSTIVGQIQIGAHTLTVNGGGAVTVNNIGRPGFFSNTQGGTLNLEGITVTPRSDRGIQVRTVNVGDGAAVDLNSAVGGSLIYLPDGTYTLNVNDGGVIHIQNFRSSGLGVHGTLNLETGGEITVGPGGGDNWGLFIGDTGKLNLSGGALTGLTDGAVYLHEHAKVTGMNGRLSDRGTAFTEAGEVTVGAAGTAAAQDQLTEGLYFWSGSLFVRGEKTPQTIRPAEYTYIGPYPVGIAITATPGYYTANDGGPAGDHTYQWYRADDDRGLNATIIPGATALTYTPGTADAGKYVCIETTPVGDGSLQGVPVKSRYLLISAAGVTDAAELKTALEGTTPATISVTDDITLESNITVGANHTLHIQSGKTLTVVGSGQITVSDGITLTLGGGGALLSTGEGGYVIRGFTTGTVTLNDITVQLQGEKSIKFLNVNVNRGATIELDSATGMNLLAITRGQTLAVNSGGTIQVRNFYQSGISCGGTLHLGGGAVRVGAGVKTPENPAPAAGLLLASNDSVLKITGGSLTGADGGTVFLFGKAFLPGAKISGAAGLFSDQGQPFTTNSEVEVESADAAARADQLTEGFYVWNGSLFTKSPVPTTVTDVIVFPATANVQKGMTQQFGAFVQGANHPAQTVTWAVSGNAKAGTSISGDGLLTVEGDEAAGTLTVTATSTVDGTKSGTAAVTVTSGPVTKYQLTVTGGTGTGEYEEGAILTVTVAAPQTGKQFKQWTATGLPNNVYTANPLTFQMPAEVVTLAAVYEDISVDTSSIDTAISAANAAKTGITTSDSPASSVANGTKFVTTAEMKALNDAISAAQTAKGTVTTTAQAQAAANTLNAATAVFQAAIKTGTYTSGSTGGGGGGGGTPSTPSTPAVTAPTEPSIPTDARTEVTAAVDGTGKATANVPEKSVTDAIKAAQDAAGKNGAEKNGISVTIDLKTDKAASSIAATLPASSINELVKAGVTELRIESGTGDIRLDLATLKAIQAAGGGNVTVSMTRADASRLSPEAQRAIGNRPVFDLSITAGGKAAAGFGGGQVSVGIPYTAAANENPGNLFGVYVDGSGKVTYLTNSSYDAKTKTLLFSTPHFSTFGIGYREAPAFTDTTGHWAEDDIDFVAARGLLSGTGNKQFSPNTGMPRGMFVTALYRLAGSPQAAGEGAAFTDVPAGSYYADAVKWASELGITSGTSATTFSPDQTITRQELAALMVNYAKAMKYTLPKTREAVTFADDANIGSWVAEAVKAMQMSGVMNGKNENRFDPTGTATRAEAAAVLRRFVELVIDPATAQGWDQNDSGVWTYYVDGKPVTGEKTIDGTTYHFDAKGLLTKIDTIAPESKKYVTHKIVYGDTLWDLAQLHHCTVAEIVSINGIKNPNSIPVGTEIKIPQRQ